MRTSDGTVYLLEGGFRARAALRDGPAWLSDTVEALAGGWWAEQDLAAEMGTREHAPAPAELADLLERLRGAGMLESATADELVAAEVPVRYARQALYLSDALGGPGQAGAAQRRLRDATVVVLGCGGLGSWALAALACVGVGRLVLVDDDRIEASNLNRQILYRHADLGRAKVDAAADFLRGFDPELTVTTHELRVGGVEDVARVAAGADVLVETADWPPHRLSGWVNEACARAGVAHVSAGQWPPSVRVGPFVLPGETACSGCLAIDARRRFPLYDDVVSAQAGRPSTAPTTGPLSGLVGSLLAEEVFAHLSGAHPPATLGRALTIDCRSLEVAGHPIAAEPGCPACALAREARSIRPLP